MRIYPASNHIVVLHFEAQDHVPLFLKYAIVAFRNFLPLKRHFFVELFDCCVKKVFHVIKHRSNIVICHG